MHHASEVERVMTRMLSDFRAKLLALLSKVAPVLIARKEIVVIQDIFQKEIYEALQEFSAVPGYKRRNGIRKRQLFYKCYWRKSNCKFLGHIKLPARLIFCIKAPALKIIRLSSVDTSRILFF